MNPASALTTPRRLICPISRHFFPVEHPLPPCCCTTGLKKGSRFPFIAHFFFSSGFGALGASKPLIAGDCFSATIFAAAAGGAGAGATVLPATFGAATAAAALGVIGLGVAATFAGFATAWAGAAAAWTTFG